MSETNNIFEQIKNATDIVSEVSVFVDLTKKGRNYWGICPFHDDTSPSMSVSPEKQLFKCFVCQVGGNVINFISNYEKISFVDATKKLADKVGIPFNSKNSIEKKYSEKDQKIFAILKEAMNFFQYSLSTPDGTKALEYLESRGITQKEIDKYAIGYAPISGLIPFLKTKEYDESLMINSSLATENIKEFFRDRVIFGIKNMDDQIVGFSARTLNPNEKAKYINSAETNLFNKKAILYNYKNAEDLIRRNKEVIITEGFMDVIALGQANILNTVAIMGTALTIEHIKYLKNKNVVLMLDSDSAGVSATIKSIKKIMPHNNSVFVIENNSGLDPDDYLRKNGAIELQKLTQQRVHALDFIFQKHMDKFGVNTPDKIEEFVKSFVKYLEGTSSTYKDFYINKLSETLKLNPETIKKFIKDVPVQKEIIEEPKSEFVNVESKKLSSTKTIDENKWSMKLLSAMLNKRALIKIFERSHVNFIDPMMQVMGGYIVKLNQGIKPTDDEDHKNMLMGIKNYSENEKDLSENEFEDLINRVNKTHKQQTLNKMQSKLDDESIDSTKVLEQMAKLIKDREK